MKPAALTRFLAVAGLAILTFCAIVTLAAMWLGAVLAVPPAGAAWAAAPVLMTILTGLSLLSTALLAPISLWALRFARRQAEESENIRLSTVYMDIVTRWNGPELVTARKLVFDLVEAFHAIEALSPGCYASAGAYIRDRLLRLRDTDKVRHREHVILLQFFEDLGLLCWKGYIREADVFDFLGAPIRTQLSALREYIDAARTGADGEVVRSRYANAIYLYRQAVAFRPNAHEEDMW